MKPEELAACQGGRANSQVPVLAAPQPWVTKMMLMLMVEMMVSLGWATIIKMILVLVSIRMLMMMVLVRKMMIHQKLHQMAPIKRCYMEMFQIDLDL